MTTNIICPEKLKVSFVYKHHNGEERKSRYYTIDELVETSDTEIMENALQCDCQPVGETNVVECNCDVYFDEFVLAGKEFAALPDKMVEDKETGGVDLAKEIFPIDGYVTEVDKYIIYSKRHGFERGYQLATTQQAQRINELEGLLTFTLLYLHKEQSPVLVENINKALTTK